MIDHLALPTWEQTAHTEAVILLKRFEGMVLCLTEDGCGQDLRNLLDVLPMIDETHTSRHILAGAVKAMRANQRESREDFKHFSRVCDELEQLRGNPKTSWRKCL